MIVRVSNGGVVYPWWRNFFQSDAVRFTELRNLNRELAKYKGRFITNNDIFTTSVEFRTEQDFMLFVMRWS